MFIPARVKLEENRIPHKLQVRLEARHPAAKTESLRDRNISETVQEIKEGSGLRILLKL